MNLDTIAPDIFRKRLLIEGYFSIGITEGTLIDFFEFLTKNLSLTPYGEPIVHKTSGAGKELNQGYDAFIPLSDSGIYIAVWSNRKFLSLIIYTCKEFDHSKALQLTKDFFFISESDYKLF